MSSATALGASSGALSLRSDSPQLFALRHHTAAQSLAARSLERLSTGLRVNRAADDAAGLAISETLRSQIGAIAIALRSTTDAISLVRVADGALAQTHQVLHDLRDLTVRALNTGAQGPDDLDHYSGQATALQRTLDTIASSAHASGRALLDGSYDATFLVGAAAGDTLGVRISLNATSAGLGLAGLGLGTFTASTTTGRADVPPVPGTSSTFTLAASSDADVAALVTALVDPATEVTVAGHSVDLTGVTTVDALEAALTAAGDVTISRTPAGLTLTAAAHGPAPVAVTGLTGTATAGQDGIAAIPGESSTVTGQVDLNNLAGAITWGSAGTLNLASVTVTGDATSRADALRAALEATFTDTTATVAADGTFTLAAHAHGTETFTVRTDTGALALETLDRAIGAVSTARAQLGASENRFEHAHATAGTTLTNLTAARGRIVDVDVAAESGQLARSQILANAATAMIAQSSTLHRDTLTALLV